MFVPNGTLKSEEKSQDARFGYALAAAPDLNHDGFTDLVVGAPLEDEHGGAIYVYHGDGIYVNPNYQQVVLRLYSRTVVEDTQQLHFSLSLIPAHPRLVPFSLPPVFRPQCEHTVGPGWRRADRFGSGRARQRCLAQVGREFGEE